MTRSPSSADTLVVEALRELGFSAAHGADWDVVVPLGPTRAHLTTVRTSLADEQFVNRLLSQAADPNRTTVVVADRVTSGARKLLRLNGAGHLDLRGHMGLHAPQILIDSPISNRTGAPPSRAGIHGKAALEVAVEILLHPDQRPPVRATARKLGRAASSVSEALSSLRDSGYLDSKNNLQGSDLFWEVASHWNSPRFLLETRPDPSDIQFIKFLNPSAPKSSDWALSGNLAAAELGAPIGVRSDEPPDFFVSDESIMRRAFRLLGSGEPGEEQAYIRPAPVKAVLREASFGKSTNHWPLVHPLFVALDLAQDEGRGRIILDEWSQKGPWTSA